MPLRRGIPSRNPITKCRLRNASRRFPALFLGCETAARIVRKALAGIAQTGGNPRHRHQQRLFHRAALCHVLLPGTGKQLGLQ